MSTARPSVIDLAEDGSWRRTVGPGEDAMGDRRTRTCEDAARRGASAVTRPFGYDGAFYLIAGEMARSVDGARGEYPTTLLPPLTPQLGDEWCARLADAWACPVAIIDMNDRGGSVRAVSAGLDIELVARITSDNPLGSSRDCTPAAVVSAATD